MDPAVQNSITVEIRLKYNFAVQVLSAPPSGYSGDGGFDQGLHSTMPGRAGGLALDCSVPATSDGLKSRALAESDSKADGATTDRIPTSLQIQSKDLGRDISVFEKTSEGTSLDVINRCAFRVTV